MLADWTQRLKEVTKSAVETDRPRVPAAPLSRVCREILALEGIYPRYALPDDERVNIVRALVGLY